MELWCNEYYTIPSAVWGVVLAAEAYNTSFDLARGLFFA